MLLIEQLIELKHEKANLTQQVYNTQTRTHTPTQTHTYADFCDNRKRINSNYYCFSEYPNKLEMSL